PQQAPAEAITTLDSLTWAGDGPQTIDIGELGRYRVASKVIGDGQRLISAVSLRAANDAIATKTAAVAAITIAAAIVAAAGTVVLVRQALRPLRRVAATAAKAARIPLADENQRITARVRCADSDPDNEVGIVGETLNRLLANVDSALAARAESDRRIRRFITDASHELRTPLATIQGYADLTRQDGPSLPATTEYALARIESESRRMSSLVGHMLLLSRL
ncbi:histidine kinase dimerization/phospho-acceptor domain-containing protein, partial [Mycobacteroides chelonae]|uniref:histidine kinase dimerization/phospho-acceptor domain-containing protein n=1 Tax=Mycobacteroides chelonae TaxID=1774 RepID=UPI0010427497